MTSHEILAHNFSNGATKGKGFNIFIEDDTIYSYGFHFPIAKRFGDNKYLFNSNSYSVSTAKHQGYVKRALYSSTIIYIKGCDINKKEQQIEQNNTDIEKATLKEKRARLDSSKNFWANEIIRLKEQNQLLKEV